MLGMPPVQFAQVNGIRMAFYEAGPHGGVPIVLCHGFPELAFSWRRQIDALAKAGRWVIAPDQRGYGLTERPEAVEAYDMEHLAGDLTGLLDHLGAKKAVWVGHDWGGIVGWRMPLLHPDRTAGVVGLNTPFMARPGIDPIRVFRSVFGEDMYIVRFQERGAPEAILEADVARTVSFFLRRPGGSEAQFSRMGVESRRSFALLNALQHYDPAKDARPRFLSPQEEAVFVETFARTGFTGGVNWYRNFSRNWEREIAAGIVEHVACPGLMLMAEHDAVLPPSMAKDMERYVPDLEKVLIGDCGHWTQQERPEAVNAAILGWLDRRFPQ